MARLRRLTVPGLPHLVLHLGHMSAPPVISDADDAAVYVDAMRNAAQEAQVEVHGYSIGHHEVRLLCTPTTDGGLAQMMQSVGRRYVRHFNARHARHGSPWSGRYRSTIVQEEEAAAVLYVVEHVDELNANGGRSLASSVDHHLGRRRDPWIKEHSCYWRLGNTPFERESVYSRIVEAGVGPGFARDLLDAAAKGWVFGSPAFAEQLDRATGRRTRPLPRGRTRRGSSRAAESVPE